MSLTPSPQNPLTIGLVQMTSGQSVSENVETASQLIREAAEAGAGYVLTPEMTTLIRKGRSDDLSLYTTEQEGALKTFCQLAKDKAITLHIGSMPIAVEGGKLANRGFLIGPEGEVAATYDKIHLFDVAVTETDTWQESAVYQAGEKAVVQEVGGVTYGMSICYDLRFAALYRALAQRGAEVLAVPAAFTVPTGLAHWHVLLRARAIETGSFVVAAAQTGTHEDGRKTFGHSLIVNPWGAIVAESGESAGLTLATVDLAEVKDARRRLPALKHDKPFRFE